MKRRNFLKNFLIGILAFIFGYSIKKDGGIEWFQYDQISEGDKSIKDNNFIVDKLNIFSKKLDGYNNIKEYNVKGDGSTGDAKAIQAAINYFRQQTIKSNFTKMAVLRFPSGKYIIDEEINLSPYVKIKSEGYVEFCVTHNGTGFYISPMADDPKFNNFSPDHLNKNSWNRGKYFDGSDGAIVFTTPLNNDKSATKTIAIEIGSRDIESDIRTPTSRYTMENINVFGYDKAIKINSVNNYIGTFKNCQFEINNHAIVYKSPPGKQINSGENFVFDNCIIALSKKEAILIDAPGHDLIFENTSFDFNSSPIFKSLRSGTSLRLNHCYIEKIGDGVGSQYIYQSECISQGEVGGRNSFYLNNVIAYLKRPAILFSNTSNKDIGYINVYLDINGLETRYQDTENKDPYNLKSRFLVNSPKISILNSKIINMSIMKSLLSKDLNLFRNGGFTLSTINTDLSVEGSDDYWFISSSAGISNPLVKKEGVAGSNCIKYSVKSPHNSMKLESKHYYNVEPGEMIFFSALMKIDKISSHAEMIYSLECYDHTDKLVDTLNYYDYIGTGKTIKSVESKFRVPRSLGEFQIPYGVYKIKPVLILNKFVSTFVCVDEVHISKSK
ncbi:glycosyl hydrolase family 28-related protein [Bacillus sp. mrc49]|uniref:glycosyl hydrolase family 28-related protein n=1 Tax=Bacillus sp. mrc49 TaxID=2054913 RepID=UPI0012FD8096|nr:glycosyl hydrolase family 28-related protein [Bacillus sp. mrc49]